MSVEAKRGCGFRKVGGLYLVAKGAGVGCGRFPIPCEVCPCCSGGIKQARGWTWINPSKLLAGQDCAIAAQVPIGSEPCMTCPFGRLVAQERAGLIWIGEQFYPTPEHFQLEAANLGISRRIRAVPRDFKLGETWVLIAHPKGYTRDDGTKGAAIVFAFKPTAIETLVTESQAKDADFMDGLVKKNLTAVVVPDDDRDHQGSVYDKSDDDEQAGKLLQFPVQGGSDQPVAP